jgi:AcrR family transcriptional regulator
MANNSKRVKRSYDSPVRREKAEQTRRSIAAAAGRLFAERGYTATSIDDIAVAAHVGRATVFTSIGGKPELLKEAYRLAVRGEADPDTPLGEQRRSREVLAEADPRALLAGYAEAMVGVGRRLAPLYEAVRAAAHADPEARELWNVLTEERRTGAGRVVAALTRRNALRPKLDRASATDILWVLNDPSVYQQLVERRRWTQGRYRAWLTEAMQHQLLEPTLVRSRSKVGRPRRTGDG